MPDRAKQRIAILALLGGAASIGFAPIFVRLSEVGPSATAFYRVLFALPFLWAWMLREARQSALLEQAGDSKAPRARTFWLCMLAGVFFAGDLGLWHWSLKLTNVATSTLLTNFAPFFVMVGAWLFFGERVTAILMAGLALALMGSALLVGRDVRLGGTDLLGDFIAVAAAVFYGAYLLTVKRLRRQISVSRVLALSGVASCPLFLLGAWLAREPLVPRTIQGWLVLAALALVSHVGGQGLITFALPHLPAGFSAVSLLLQPVVAGALAWVLFHERLDALQILGGVVILAGIALASRSRAG